MLPNPTDSYHKTNLMWIHLIENTQHKLKLHYLIKDYSQEGSTIAFRLRFFF